ncbi:MAG: DUF6288 domain-containing protein, partial [Phycisphaeraceae bacterium]|nr:DUF6288 domain-containing protein [Phycisphaeraceae bacterium]
MKSYYGTNVYHVGHTGGGMGEIWKSASMALMTDQRPRQYRDYMDARKWAMELSRRHNGGIGIGGGMDGNYDKAVGEANKNIAWGNYFALAYTLPRKHLHLFGAPRSPWARSYQLPVRPWGTAADDDFVSAMPVDPDRSALTTPGDPAISRADIRDEVLHQHAGHPVGELLSDKNVSDRDIITYLHHPEITHRTLATAAVVRLRKDDILLGLLQSEDARLQHRGVMILHEYLGTWRRNNKDPSRVTPAMWDRVAELVRDPEASWFVKQWALGLLQHTDMATLRTFKDTLVELMEHEAYWVHGSAISASDRLFADPAHYRETLPPAVKTITTSNRYFIVTRASRITKQMKNASPEIREYALEMLKPVYTSLPNQMISEQGNLVKSGASVKRESLGKVLGFSEEGEFFLQNLPKATSAWKISGRMEDKFVFGGKFEPNPQLHGKWFLINHNKFGNQADAIDWIQTQLKKNKVPARDAKKTKYGFQVKPDGSVKVLGFSSFKYGKRMQYSRDMFFKTYIDKAYHYEIMTVGGRQFLMVEEDFE